MYQRGFLLPIFQLIGNWVWAIGTFGQLEFDNWDLRAIGTFGQLGQNSKNYTITVINYVASDINESAIGICEQCFDAHKKEHILNPLAM